MTGYRKSQNAMICFEVSICSPFRTDKGHVSFKNHRHGSHVTQFSMFELNLVASKENLSNLQNKGNS